MVRIIQADLSHLDQITPLFDAYRPFYKEPQDLDKASAFLKARLEREESIIFLALTAAKEFGKKAGAVWLRLETDKTNIPGQTLYEKMNWERDNDFYTYFLSLDD